MLAICKGLSFTPPVPEKNTLSTFPSPLNEVRPLPFWQFFSQVVEFCCPLSFFSWAQSRAWLFPTQSRGFGGHSEPPSPHLGLGNRNIWYEITISARADGISASKYQMGGCRKQDKEPQTIQESEMLMMHFKLPCLKHLQEHRLGVFAGSPPAL